MVIIFVATNLRAITKESGETGISSKSIPKFARVVKPEKNPTGPGAVKNPVSVSYTTANK